MPRIKRPPFTVRQGDVLITRVAKLPAKTVPLDPRSDTRGLVLAEGEATGHAHTLAWADVAAAVADGPVLYFDAPVGATVKHQEHDPIALPPGRYKALRQREYSPATIRNVAD